jgi:putative N6-adenine-specific DNA methylase
LHFLIKTLRGLEPVLQRELIRSGAANIREVTRGYTCEADLRWMYKANYTLRTALRILVPIDEFQARDDRDLYEGIYAIDWQQYMTVSQTFAVDAVCRSNYFTHSQYAALKTKDAIVDQFRERNARRPDVNTAAPHLLVHIHIQDDLVTVLLDSSGGSLHRRGYRREQVEAPINEVLAAGMIQIAEWKGETTFFDPMCGSGTLAIEAALLAKRVPAQYFRPGLGFQKWFDFDKKLWAEVKEECDALILPKPECAIFASDRDAQARNITAANMMAADVGKDITVTKAVFATGAVPESAGTMMFNPPYDERMQEDDIIKTYREYGDVMKQRFDGWQAWIISSNRSAIKNVGLRPDRRFTVYNGALECSFQKFSLWKKLDEVPQEEVQTDPDVV